MRTRDPSRRAAEGNAYHDVYGEDVLVGVHAWNRPYAAGMDDSEPGVADTIRSGLRNAAGAHRRSVADVGPG